MNDAVQNRAVHGNAFVGFRYSHSFTNSPTSEIPRQAWHGNGRIDPPARGMTFSRTPSDLMSYPSLHVLLQNQKVQNSNQSRKCAHSQLRHDSDFYCRSELLCWGGYSARCKARGFVLARNQYSPVYVGAGWLAGLSKFRLTTDGGFATFVRKSLWA